MSVTGKKPNEYEGILLSGEGRIEREAVGNVQASPAPPLQISQAEQGGGYRRFTLSDR